MSVHVQKIGDFGLDKSLLKFKALKKTMPKIIGNEAKNHFREGFRNGGGQTDAGKWQSRQLNTGAQRANLVQSGTLRDDIEVKQATFSKTVVGTSQLTDDYAKIHNEGGSIGVTKKMKKFFFAKSFNAKNKEEKQYYLNLALTKKQILKIPKREYIGDSITLNVKVIKKINKLLKPVFYGR